ncbi:MAG: SDR family oxidoreductase [Myxococcales bacterium]|nr:MAG: SDR family oxidoreductase [Myxococcales bacterium]
MAHVLIIGCGYVGIALGQRLLGKDHVVWALRRNPAELPVSFKPIEADLLVPNTLRHLPDVDYVFYTAAPDSRDEKSYQAIYLQGLKYTLAALEQKKHKPQRVFFTSSTSVYSQSDGQWVDEESKTDGNQPSSEILLQAEKFLKQSSLPSTVVRLSGIYGPGRTRLLESVKEGQASYSEDQVSYTNRIHRDDCAGVLAHLMQQQKPEALYLASDHDPVDRKTLLCWIATRLAAPAPKSSTQAQGRNRSNKRCLNEKLLKSGYVFRYPSYKEGYNMIIERMSIR